jgi:hypothetical protein
MTNSASKTYAVMQLTPRSTFNFNGAFYPNRPSTSDVFRPARIFDFKAWTSWDVPVFAYSTTTDGYELWRTNASVGLKPEAIQTRWGLEADNTTFSVPAHIVTDRNTEYDLGYDLNTFVNSVPTRVVQDVNMHLNYSKTVFATPDPIFIEFEAPPE